MFKASQNLDLVNSKGKKVLVKKGDVIPDEFITSFLLHNRHFIENLTYKNSIPVLSKEQEKKYGVSFEPPKKTEFKVKGDKYNQEKLTRRLNRMGDDKFKEWAEKEVGEDVIDRRKSSMSIITQLLRIQEEQR